MSDAAPSDTKLEHPAYEIFIGALSILSIFNLVLLYGVREKSLEYVIMSMNLVLSIVLFGDFCYRLLTAPSRMGYLLRDYGWADFLASLPLSQLKVLRIFRLVRVYRILRTYGGRRVRRRLIRERAGSALFTLLLMAILVLQFGSLVMLRLESGAPDATITTASDAIWFNIVTMATVGYGDTYPVTNWGRFFGSFIIIIGVGIFGTLTGYLANAFVGAGRSPAPPEPRPAGTDPDGALARLDALDAAVEQQKAALGEIERLLQAHRRALAHRSES